ncbi:MAG: VWA domain-containing protein, partial [Dolichospermum sp.]
LMKNQPIKPQSVVWVTDAPLGTKPGITSEIWIETPGDSPFRIAESPLSQERQKWIETLPLKERSLTIKNQDNKDYKLSVVDLNPTVQEFCTPAPGGKETCLVNPYLLKQLWVPGLILLLLIAAGVWSSCKFARLQKKWKLRITFKDNTEDEQKLCILPNKKKIALCEYDPSCDDCIDVPGGDIRGHLKREGEKLYLVPTPEGNIQLNNKKIISKTLITNSRFTLNCPDSRQRDYQINVKIEK